MHSSLPQFEIMFKTASPMDVLDRVAALLAQQRERYEITEQRYPTCLPRGHMLPNPIRHES